MCMQYKKYITHPLSQLSTMSSLCNIVCEGCLLQVNACTLRFLFTLPGCTSFASQILPVRLVYSSFIIDGSECHVNRNIIFKLANIISKQKPSAPDLFVKKCLIDWIKAQSKLPPIAQLLTFQTAQTYLQIPAHCAGRCEILLGKPPAPSTWTGCGTLIIDCCKTAMQLLGSIYETNGQNKSK